MDKELVINKENVIDGIRMDTCKEDNILTRCDEVPVRIFLSNVDEDKFGMNFLTEQNKAVLLCFEYTNNDEINQIICENVKRNKGNVDGYAINGAINENLGITYHKKK